MIDLFALGIMKQISRIAFPEYASRKVVPNYLMRIFFLFFFQLTFEILFMYKQSKMSKTRGGSSQADQVRATAFVTRRHRGGPSNILEGDLGEENVQYEDVYGEALAKPHVEDKSYPRG